MIEPFFVLASIILLIGIVAGYLRTASLLKEQISLLKETNDKIHYWAGEARDWQREANTARRTCDDLTIRLDEARKIAGMDKEKREEK